MCLPVAIRNVATGPEQDVCNVSYLIHHCQHIERGQQYAYGGLSQGGWICLPNSFACCSVITWFHSPRLETRTKESNMCVSSWVAKPMCTMKILAGKFAPATDHSILRSLNMNMPVRTRKMVNYASERQTQEKLWWKPLAPLQPQLGQGELPLAPLDQLHIIWLHHLVHTQAATSKLTQNNGVEV